MASGINEKEFSESDPTLLVESLAKAKAKAVVKKLWTENQSLLPRDYSQILGCDSVFAFDGEIFGKPQDSNEAVQRWIRMSGGYGFLHTGHALYTKEIFFQQGIDGFSSLQSQVVTTKVIFDQITLNEIRDYVATGEPFDCAGGFALEGIGGMFIRRIEGCYSNVIGLSLPWLRKFLSA